MNKLKVGDIVSRKSYNKDILFKIRDIIEAPNQERIMILKGVELRIVADSPESDLEKVTVDSVEGLNKSFNDKIDKIVRNIIQERSASEQGKLTRSIDEEIRMSRHHFGRVGKVLHLDGDGEYLDLCLKIYEQLEIEATGKIIPESEQPKVIVELLREYNPDILVLTGHDSVHKENKDFHDIEGYKHSKYFVEAVRKARSYEPNMDELVIFAGACQSFFERIIDAGANFASSPHRTLMR